MLEAIVHDGYMMNGMKMDEYEYMRQNALAPGGNHLDKRA